MDRDLVALLGFVAMFVLMALRVPIGVAMGIVGVAGLRLHHRSAGRRSICSPTCRCRC